MLSGIGPADELRSVGIRCVHDLPGVGENLQDHLDVDSAAVLQDADSTYDGNNRGLAPIAVAGIHAATRNGPGTSQRRRGRRLR